MKMLVRSDYWKTSDFFVSFQSILFRSSRQRCSVKKAFQACSFIKKELQHGCFPVNFGKFLRTLILKNICERLLQFIKTWKASIKSVIMENVTKNTHVTESVLSEAASYILASFLKNNSVIGVPFEFDNIFQNNHSLEYFWFSLGESL